VYDGPGLSDAKGADEIPTRSPLTFLCDTSVNTACII